MSEKPYKGEISSWVKIPFDVEATKKLYGEDPGLGFIIAGTFENHPKFGRSPGGTTSWIVHHNEETGEIETRNSRYKLVGPAANSP